MTKFEWLHPLSIGGASAATMMPAITHFQRRTICQYCNRIGGATPGCSGCGSVLAGLNDPAFHPDGVACNILSLSEAENPAGCRMLTSDGVLPLLILPLADHCHDF